MHAELIPVSSTLRLHALERNDNDLNVESGFPVLATLLADRVTHAEHLVRRAVCNTVLGVTEQLSASLSAELGVQQHPETLEETVGELRVAKERVSALRDRSARWQQTLSDGVADLTADIDYDLRDRMRDIMRNAEDEIDLLGDPAVVWDEFSPWVNEQVASATSANFVWANERANWLAARVAQHFAEDGQAAMPELELQTGSALLNEVRPMYLDTDDDPGIGEKALTGLRGGYIGTLMFGMFSTVAGMALINPFSVGAGLLLGGKTIREEKKRSGPAAPGGGQGRRPPLHRRRDLPGRQGLARHAAQRPTSAARPLHRGRDGARDLAAGVDAHRRRPPRARAPPSATRGSTSCARSSRPSPGWSAGPAR